MKRYVLFAGGTGTRAAQALLTAAAAGVTQADHLTVLLADTDLSGSRSAEMLRAQAADYERVRAAFSVAAEQGANRPFRTALTLHAWPRQLPGDACTLADWTALSEEDALLCQAMFDGDAAQLDLRGGFHGRRALGRTVIAGLLEEAAKDPEDVLTLLIAEMNAALEAGEEVRVVLAGSVCGGTGAAALPLMARHIQEQTKGRARIGAVLLAASGDYEDAAQAREALAEFAAEGACSAVCVLGLPRSSCTAAPADYAQLTDWLAVYCMDVLLHRPAWPEGLFTVQAPEGPLTWEIFGKAGPRYRRGYGRLFKAAAAWGAVIGPQVEKRLTRPFFLRDGLFGWYAHFFRRAGNQKEMCLEDVKCLSRLMRVMLLWLGGLMRTLPPEMTHAAEMSQVRQEAEQHYRGLTELVGQLALLDDDVQRTGEYEDGRVYRSREEQSGEKEQTLRRIDAVKQEIADRIARQEQLNRRLGGANVMRMLQDAQDAAQAEGDELRARYTEANRRIDHAESIAAPEDLYRITDARTKLERMVRHQQVLDAREAFIQGDVQKASADAMRFARPVTAGSSTGGLFHDGFTGRLLAQDKRLKAAEVEGLWPEMVIPADGRTLKATLKRIRKAEVDGCAPVMSLMRALILEAMEEV